jgi:hypothetical protein
MSGEQKRLDKLLWGCLLAIMGRRRGSLCLTRLQCFISSSHRHRILNCHRTVGHWRWLSKWLTFRSRGSASSLNCHLFVTLYMCKSFTSMNISLFWSQYSFWNHSRFNFAFMGKSLSAYVISIKVAGLGTTSDENLRTLCLSVYLTTLLLAHAVQHWKAGVTGKFWH